MILQALKEYYDRKVLSSDSDIAPYGFEKKELQFLIVIDKQGECLGIEDLREKIGTKLVGKSYILPRSVSRTGQRSYATTFLLWDHIGYVLGLPSPDNDKRHNTWLQHLTDLPPSLKSDEGVQAVIRFYENDGAAKAMKDPQVDLCLKATPCNMSFRLASDTLPVVCRQAVADYVRASGLGQEDEESEDSVETGLCMITGEEGIVARTHNKTPIDKDAKCLVGFQRSSGYDSYGKEQGYNAPVIRTTEFAYVTGLNTLLKTRSQRMQVGDAVTVFWADKESSFETDFAAFFEEPAKDDPEAKTQKVRQLFDSVGVGSYLEDAEKTKFYVLGLSPNSARISVRFWHVGTIAEMADRVRQHFTDFAIIKPTREPEFYSIWRTLVSIAIQDKSDRIPPNLAGEFMRSILTGSPYPATMLQAALRRIRADVEHRVTPVRAAIIKACLTRCARLRMTLEPDKEVGFALDSTQASVGYQLGRLFASLEKIQEEANPGINATIRERYYGSACASPVVVFPVLLRLKNHHLAKMENRGRVVTFERLLGEIMGNLQDIPSHLQLFEQGRFAIGYYHQRQAFFTKKIAEGESQVEEEKI